VTERTSILPVLLRAPYTLIAPVARQLILTLRQTLNGVSIPTV